MPYEMIIHDNPVPSFGGNTIEGQTIRTHGTNGSMKSVHIK